MSRVAAALWILAWAAAGSTAGALSQRRSLRSGRGRGADPICTLGPRGNFSTPVLVYANPHGNTRTLQFMNDLLGSETIVKCKGPMPEGCSGRDCDENSSCACEPDGTDTTGYITHMLETLEPMCTMGKKRRFRVLLIGLGGGAIPAAVLARCPKGTEVESVEYDPRVIEAATRFFGLSLRPGVNRVEQGEGGEAVRQRVEQGKKYDVILVDAFANRRVPASCRSREFLGNLRWLLWPGGVVLQNTQTADKQEAFPIYKQVFGAGSVSSWSYNLGTEQVIRAAVPDEAAAAAAS